MSKGYGVDQAIANVPQKFKNDAGLNYDRLKWRRKKGRVDSSTEILLKIRNDKEYLVDLTNGGKKEKLSQEHYFIKKNMKFHIKFQAIME